MTPPALTEPGAVSPLRELFAVAWPTVLTMTSYTIMQFVDGLMVSRIGGLMGPSAFAAQGNGGIFAFTPISIVIGVLSMVNTYVSQNLGAGRPREGPRYAWNALWLSVVAWLVLVPFGFALPAIFARMGHSDELVAMESSYGRILILGCFVTMATRGLSHFFYGLHRPRVVFVASVVGNLVNVFGNWVLIYGHLGAPALGVSGAAIATVIGTCVELVIPMALFLSPRFDAEFGTRAAWRPNYSTMRDLLRVGWPKSLTFGNEMICWAIFMTYLVGRFGEDHNAAGWIALRYMHLSFMPAVGISFAVTAVVGKYIGAGRPDLANHRAWLGVRLAMAYMGFCALTFIVFRRPMVNLFIDTEDAARAASILDIGMRLLICAAVFQLFDAMAISLSGALNGAGDTLWPGIVTMITSWTLIVGLGWTLSKWAPQLESLGPWIGAATYIISLGLAFLWRWRSGKWRQINLLGRGATTAAVAA